MHAPQCFLVETLSRPLPNLMLELAQITTNQGQMIDCKGPSLLPYLISFFQVNVIALGFSY